MGKRVPGPRKRPKQFTCSWCGKVFDSAFKLGYHVNDCTVRMSKCKHPRWKRKKKFTGKITIGTKRYKTWSVTCKVCGTKLPNKTKEVK